MLSRFQWRRLSVADRPWRSHIRAIARRTGAPVLPIHLRAPRHWSGQFCGLVLPLLHNIRSLAAVKKFRGKSIKVTIGRLIQPNALQACPSDAAATAFLQRATEALACT
jgi:hypothetical protein